MNIMYLFGTEIKIVISRNVQNYEKIFFLKLKFLYLAVSHEQVTPSFTVLVGTESFSYMTCFIIIPSRYSLYHIESHQNMWRRVL